MTVFQMLSEVIGAEELLGLIAFPEFVPDIQVLRTSIPVRRIGEFVATIATDIVRCTACRGSVKGRTHTRESGTRPRMEAQMEGVLVPFRLILVFESI
jgi:hypothetical protein